MTFVSVLPIVIIAIILILYFLMTVLGRRKGYRGIGGKTIVRCNKGHLFTTIWVPGASFKSVRLGFKRFQYCPVGRHWTIVAPIKESELTNEEKSLAAKNLDTRIP